MRTINAFSKRSRQLMRIAGVLFVSVMLTGCLGSYGKVRIDNELAGQFLNGDVPADYNYYYNGREFVPYAIIGLRPQYTLASKHWHPVTPNTKDFKRMARGLYSMPDYDRPAAGVLIAPDGRELGIWYSFSPWATITMKGPGEVSILSPYQPTASFDD